MCKDTNFKFVFWLLHGLQGPVWMLSSIEFARCRFLQRPQIPAKIVSCVFVWWRACVWERACCTAWAYARPASPASRRSLSAASRYHAQWFNNKLEIKLGLAIHTHSGPYSHHESHVIPQIWLCLMQVYLFNKISVKKKAFTDHSGGQNYRKTWRSSRHWSAPGSQIETEEERHIFHAYVT